jgi:hypothetical protein
MEAKPDRNSEWMTSENELCALCGETFPTPNALAEHQAVSHHGAVSPAEFDGGPPPPTHPRRSFIRRGMFGGSRNPESD